VLETDVEGSTSCVESVSVPSVYVVASSGESFVGLYMHMLSIPLKERAVKALASLSVVLCLEVDTSFGSIPLTLS
jgi:hypothetical protein